MYLNWVAVVVGFGALCILSGTVSIITRGFGGTYSYFVASAITVFVGILLLVAGGVSANASVQGK